MRGPTLIVLLTTALGCDSGASLIVEAKTDLVPGVEFVAAEVVVEQGGRSIPDMVPALRRDDWLAGFRVSEVDGLKAGPVTVTASLVDADGAAVVRRVAQLTIDGDVGITLLFTRSCRSTVCPGPTDPASLSTCIGGLCAEPECLPETPESCPPPACSSDAECPPPTDPCAAALCVSGSCFAGVVAGTCAEDEACIPETGCVPVVSRSDASTSDGGPDADAGDGDADAGDAAIADATPDAPSCDVCGDSNGDGVVDVADQISATNAMMSGMMPPCPNAADVVGDGAITERDIAAIRQIILATVDPITGCTPCALACADPNGSGSTTIADIVRLGNLRMTPGPICEAWAADVNANGELDDEDETIMGDILMGSGAPMCLP